jgi:hypothetical protein
MLACVALGIFFLMCLIGAILKCFEKPKERIPHGAMERWWELDIK